MPNLNDIYEIIERKITQVNPDFRFVKPETAKVIQKFVKEKILDKYRNLKDFNSYLDLCFGSGNLSIHILEALKFFEDNQAKIKEGKKVVFNDRYNFPNWELKEKIEGIDFIKKDVFSADFFKDVHIRDKKYINEEKINKLSMFITYLEYREKILNSVRNVYNSDFTYKKEKITLREGRTMKASLKEKEVLLKILNKEFSFSDNKEKNEEVLNKILEETKKKVGKDKYIPKRFDFITANFLITSSENPDIGSIKLTEERKIILNVIFDYFLSEKGVFLFVKKASSDRDFEELKNIFGESVGYITVFNIPELTNEVNFVFKKPVNQEEAEAEIEQ